MSSVYEYDLRHTILLAIVLPWCYDHAMNIDTIINYPTVTTMRDVLDKIEQQFGPDQHVEVKPIANGLGSFVVRPVNLDA